MSSYLRDSRLDCGALAGGGDSLKQVITAAEVALPGLLWPEYGETLAAEGEADWPLKAAFEVALLVTQVDPDYH